jgi:hypothetical protein
VFKIVTGARTFEFQELASNANSAQQWVTMIKEIITQKIENL